MPTYGKTAEKIAKESSVIGDFQFSFSSNCGVQNSAETVVARSRLSYLEMGGNIQISNLLKTSAIDV